MRIIALFLSVLAALAPFGASAQMAPPIPMTSTQFTNSSKGSSIQIVVRIDSVARQTIKATVLNRQTDTQYTVSKVSVQVYLADGTPVVMGNLSDVSPGALIFVNGVVTDPLRADIKRIVVLTKYLTVSR